MKHHAATLCEEVDPAPPRIRVTNRIEPRHSSGLATKYRVVQANLWLVGSIVKRCVTENDGTFELINESNVSSVHAVEEFNYTRGFRFSTYASCAIKKNNVRQLATDMKRRSRFPTSHDEALVDCLQDHFDPQQVERDQR